MKKMAKKVMLFLLLFSVLFCGVFSSRWNLSEAYDGEFTRDYGGISYDYHYWFRDVYTPNESLVICGNYKPYSIVEEMPTSQINDCDAYVDHEYLYFSKLDSATNSYNCHSYDWYDRTTNNDIWIGTPETYILDGSYVATSDYSVGHIVVYYDMFNYPIHSAVISQEKTPGCHLSTLEVTSKWGNFGLYEHYVYECPYVY